MRPAENQEEDLGEGFKLNTTGTAKKSQDLQEAMMRVKKTARPAKMAAQTKVKLWQAQIAQYGLNILMTFAIAVQKIHTDKYIRELASAIKAASRLGGNVKAPPQLQKVIDKVNQILVAEWLLLVVLGSLQILVYTLILISSMLQYLLIMCTTNPIGAAVCTYFAIQNL